MVLGSLKYLTYVKSNDTGHTFGKHEHFFCWKKKQGHSVTAQTNSSDNTTAKGNDDKNMSENKVCYKFDRLFN